jgi:hypothetical protein
VLATPATSLPLATLPSSVLPVPDVPAPPLSKFVSTIFHVQHHPSCTTWVIAESWPSWLYAIPGVQVSISIVFFPDPTALDLAPLCTMFPTTTWFPLHRFSSMPVHHPMVILGQGSLEFWSDWSLHLIVSLPMIFCFDLVSPTSWPQVSPGWYPSFWSHQEAGGVLSGTWLCFLNSHWSSFSRFTLPFWCTLRHLINTASPPSPSWLIHPSPSPPTSAPPAVLRDSTLPVSSVLAWVTCLSVFYPRQWVTHPLTSGELASAFDLPHCLASSMLLLSAVCLSAPANILSSIWNSCYRIKVGMMPLNRSSVQTFEIRMVAASLKI